MAFTVTETKLVLLAGGVAKLYGTYLSDSGSTGGVISPGNSATTVSGSSGIRFMDEVKLMPSTSSPAATRYAIAYNATTDTTECTVTTAANEGGRFVVEGSYVGTAAN